MCMRLLQVQNDGVRTSHGMSRMLSSRGNLLHGTRGDI